VAIYSSRRPAPSIVERALANEARYRCKGEPRTLLQKSLREWAREDHAVRAPERLDYTDPASDYRSVGETPQELPTWSNHSSDIIVTLLCQGYRFMTRCDAASRSKPPPCSGLKNQAGGRAVSEQAPLAIGESTFSSANPPTAMQHCALCLDRTRFRCDRPYEGNFEFDRRLS
jgi:hypothetical protein